VELTFQFRVNEEVPKKHGVFNLPGVWRDMAHTPGFYLSYHLNLIKKERGKDAP
jgi:hypothetical protein